MDQIQETAAIVTDRIDKMFSPIGNFWAGEMWGGDGSNRTDKKHRTSTFGVFRDQIIKTKDKKPWINKFGPGGAVGIGCGAGIGIAVIGGAGVGSAPWNALRPVLGIGVGCGIGLGYGYGLGLGVRWDKRIKSSPASKRVVIEI